MFYEQLTKLCAQNHISLTTLATKELHMSVSNVTKWKNGNVPKSDTVQKIAAYFNVSTDYLLGNVPQEHFAEKHEPTELERILEKQPGLMFHGAPLTEDDRAKLITAINAVMSIEDKKHKK